jgi:hypothetical protein
VRWRTGVHLNQQVDFVVGERLIGPAAEIEDARGVHSRRQTR